MYTYFVAWYKIFVDRTDVSGSAAVTRPGTVRGHRSRRCPVAGRPRSSHRRRPAPLRPSAAHLGWSCNCLQFPSAIIMQAPVVVLSTFCPPMSGMFPRWLMPSATGLAGMGTDTTVIPLPGSAALWLTPVRVLCLPLFPILAPLLLPCLLSLPVGPTHYR